MDAIVEKYSDHYGTIHYRETQNFANELAEILERAKDIQSATTVMDIAILLLNKTIESYQYADNSGGSIGWGVTQAIGVMEEITIETESEDVALKVVNQVQQPIENLEKLTTRFYSENMSETEKSSGLGLYITNELVELLGG